MSFQRRRVYSHCLTNQNFFFVHRTLFYEQHEQKNICVFDVHHVANFDLKRTEKKPAQLPV